MCPSFLPSSPSDLNLLNVPPFVSNSLSLSLPMATRGSWGSRHLTLCHTLAPRVPSLLPTLL